MRAILLPLLPLLALPVAAAQAQSIQVAPVTVEFAPGQQAAVLTVSNEAAVKAMFQVRPFAWTSGDNADQLAPTELLAVSPPFAEVEAGQTQTIRLVLRRPADGREASFRVLIDELPPPRPAGTVKIALRLSIPVFAAPAERAEARISGRISVGGGGAELMLENRGARHTRVLHASIESDTGMIFPVQTVPSPYLLAGAQRRWPIDGGARLRAGGAARVTVVTDAGPVDVVVPVSPAR